MLRWLVVRNGNRIGQMLDKDFRDLRVLGVGVEGLASRLVSAGVYSRISGNRCGQKTDSAGILDTNSHRQSRDSGVKTQGRHVPRNGDRGWRRFSRSRRSVDRRRGKHRSCVRPSRFHCSRSVHVRVLPVRGDIVNLRLVRLA